MRANRIETGKVYEIAVGKNATTVKVVKVERRVNGQPAFQCKNAKTGKPMLVIDSKRFLKEVKTAKPTPFKGGKPLSGINAAYRVLKEAKRPLRVKEIAEIALRNNYCKLKGATPEFTISAVLQRDIKDKGTKSRFVKPERGLFAAR